jgi:SAM-dependent methyltransferase
MGLRLNGTQGARPREATGIAVSIKKCRDCELVFADPQPIPALLSDHYGVPPDAYWSANAFEWSPAYFAEEITTAKRLLPFRQGMTALDIGVGLGKAMQSLTHAGFDAWGIEPSEPFYQRAVERIGPERLRLAAVEDAHFDAASFDFITFGAVLEHIYRPSEALAKALHWLKPGGIIQVEVPSSAHFMSKIFNLYFRLMGTNYVTNISPMHTPFHLYEFGLTSFERNGRINGYEIAEHLYQVCGIYHVPKALHGPLRWWMARTNTGMQLTVYLRKV